MGFDRNPMGSERFQSDPMVGWDGSTGEANQKSYSYLDQMSYESIFNDQSSDESIFNDQSSDEQILMMKHRIPIAPPTGIWRNWQKVCLKVTVFCGRTHGIGATWRHYSGRKLS
ncbi:unnamed protein product [Rotaria socialis]|uniref:Uncharacterized protein n=2 Tax=Rotaria socialis TaxID=392032 RepID=A0A820XBR9_9BILA|nr:unnamed protein product [Rotaria socialis]